MSRIEQSKYEKIDLQGFDIGDILILFLKLNKHKNE